MEASSSTHRSGVAMVVRGWPWWRLPPLLRVYVASAPVAAVVLFGFVVGSTSWQVLDVLKYLLLLGCGLVLMAATPRTAYSQGPVSRDFLTIWVLPVAILLPPAFAILAPIPLLAFTQVIVMRKTLVYRRVFTAGAMSLSYGLASLLFRVFPATFAGATIGTGIHALTWTVAVAACEILGGRGHHFLIVGAIKLSDPSARLADLEWNREAIQGDLAEFDLAVMTTVVIAISPALAIFAVPMVLLVRRFMMHAQLVAQARTDAKTGLLNVSTWEREADAELSRAVRTRSPLALVLVDIDHFKVVNDTHGHLAGDKVLRAVADALTGQLRDYDRAGRFGGEEFVLLLAQTKIDDACRIAERLRAHVAEMAVAVDDRHDAAVVRLTISAGVAAIAGYSSCELTDLLAAADSALYRAKQTGRNRVAVAPVAVQDVELEVGISDPAEMRQANPTGA